MTEAPATTGQTRALPDPTSMAPESWWHRIDRTDLPRTALVAACAIGAWTAALAVTVFALAAKILEDLTAGRIRDALTDLIAILPATVRG